MYLYKYSTIIHSIIESWTFIATCLEWKLAMASGSDCSQNLAGESSSSAKSDVWKYFVKDNDGNKAECKLCSKVLAYRGGTTNLRNHLKSQHPLRYDKKQESADGKGKMKQAPLTSFVQPRSCSDARSKAITERIADMIALDLRPIRMVEGKGFLEVLALLEPGYKVPSRKHFTKIIHQKHDVAQVKLRETIAEEADKVALTTDIWTSSATEAYMTATLHYISPSWDLRSFVLATTAFPERHTGAAIAEELKRMVQRYGMKEKVSAVVHDQAANMELCHAILCEDEGWESVHCSAHCLQLCLKAGLSIPAIDRLLGAARKLVGHFSHSVVATEELKTREAQMNMAEKKLVKDVATRWNSSFYMLDRLLELRWPVSAVLSDETVTKRADRYLDLQSDQWALATDLVDTLRPFEVATTFFSYEENASLSAVLPVLFGLLDGLRTLADDSALISQFKETVADQIRTRWSLHSLDPSSSLVLAAAVDPRFKQLKFLSEDDVASVKEVLLMRMEEHHKEQAPSTEEPPKKQRKTALDVLLGPDTEASSDGTPKGELASYFAEPPSPRNELPLTWWKHNGFRFPCLTRVARSLHNIPATSTPSERVFSTAGLTVTKLRTCLKPKNVDSLVFLNKNLKHL